MVMVSALSHVIGLELIQKYKTKHDVCSYIITALDAEVLSLFHG